jgi:integrase
MIESEMSRGVWISRGEAEATTLYECLDRYLREVLPFKKGRVQETSVIEYFKREPISKRFMASIRSSDIAAWRDAHLTEVSAATVVRKLGVLSHVFNTARREWGLESLSNPVGLVRKPRLPKGRERRLLPGELDALLAASQSTELRAMLCLVLESSMRRGELVSLEWKNVNLSRRLLVLPDTKNGETRTVPLSTTAIDLLAKLSRRIDGRVFGLRADSITQAFARARERGRATYLGSCIEQRVRPNPRFLVDLRFHDQRHEATSRFFEKGLNPMEVSCITGHKDLRSLKRYTHLEAAELAKKLG